MGVSAQAAVASRIIKRFGQAGILRRVENFGDSWAPVQANIDTPVTVALTQYDQELIGGTLIGTADLRALVSVGGLTVAPTTADRLIIAGTTYVIARVSPLAPDGVARFWELQVRT